MNLRLKNLKNLLVKNSLDAALISKASDIIYLTGFSHFHHIEREAFLLITKTNNYIFTDGRYTQAVQKHLDNDVIAMSRSDEAIPFKLLEISPQNPFKDLLKNIIQEEKITSLGIEESNITVAEHKKIVTIVKNPKHFDLSELRMQKDEKEISAIQKACELGDRTFAFTLDKIKPGITEKELAFEMESFIRRNGAEISFSTIVAFEGNASLPHHKTGLEKLKNNDTILLDFGVRYENYCSDMTRTLFLGKASSEKKRVYTTVLAAQQKAIEYLSSCLSRPSSCHSRERGNPEDINKIPLSSIDKIARDYIISRNFPTIPHGLGHGIGLEVHESPSLSPNSKDTLKKGMVFSIEPGIYLTDSIGVRIEDLFAIQDNSLLQLTKSPKTLIEL